MSEVVEDPTFGEPGSGTAPEQPAPNGPAGPGGPYEEKEAEVSTPEEAPEVVEVEQTEPTAQEQHAKDNEARIADVTTPVVREANPSFGGESFNYG